MKDVPRWDRTEVARAVLGDVYSGKPAIERDSRIKGGIYYGASREAISVDPSEYPENYSELYSAARRRATTNGSIAPAKILRAVYKTVFWNMEYSQKGVQQLLQSQAEAQHLEKFPPGKQIDLGVFMGRHVGVCRHQALACAMLLETFKDDGFLLGSISVDRNSRWDPKRERTEGHAWTRYTSQNRQVVILDVAQRYFGPLGTLEEMGSRWNYMRPEEQANEAASTVTEIIFQNRPD
jgi:predicted Fe-S protein YdhL (DUF1289 family)